jgi:hypothetical protein
MIKTYKGNITSLKDDEVFSFGANQNGFHGSGSAGFASFGVSGNQWRKFDYGNKPHGWKGKWNEKGKTGPMMGTEGKSYGLVTIKKAGDKRSLPPEELRKNVKEFYKFAKSRPKLKFYVAQSSDKGLNGYEPIEMAFFFCGAIPDNVYFQEGFSKLLDEAQNSWYGLVKNVQECGGEVFELIIQEIKKYGR